MDKKNSSYLDIFKSTSLLGSIQLITIIVSVVRSKFVAMLLGPAGMGLNGLFLSMSSLITTFTSLGIPRSAVKNIASTSKTDELGKINDVISTLMLMMWITGILSSLFTFIFSDFLSEHTFGNKDYSVAFKWIAISILFTQLASGYESSLRGMHKVKWLASASLQGSLSGLFISIPIYYIYGERGIVPAIIVSSITLFIINFFYYKKLKIKTNIFETASLINEGKDMLKIGIVLSISSVLIIAESYYVRVFIRAHGSIEDVGYYNAGIAIVNTYFGLFFSSITMDYYPKLAAIANDNLKAIKLMVEQSEMTVLIISPFLILFIAFIEPIVIILYSKEFIPLIKLVLWASLGIYFKAASYAIGVIFISKGDIKTLFWTEILSTIVLFTLNIGGYLYYGLEGLGVSFLVSNIFVYIQNYLIVRYRYSFMYSNNFIIVFIVNLLLGISALISSKSLYAPFNIILGSLVLAIALCYSITELNKRMNLLHFLSVFLKKK